MNPSNHPRNEYLTAMSRYNRWMNENLYAVCAELSDIERKADRGASYYSIHGILNHLLLADRLLLSRALHHPFVFHSLSQELYSEFGELRTERTRTDNDIDDWVRHLTQKEDNEFTEPVCFQSATYHRRVCIPLWQYVLHFFNHQTHHRGQLTTLLHQIGCDVGKVDLLWLPGIEIGPDAVG